MPGGKAAKWEVAKDRIGAIVMSATSTGEASTTEDELANVVEAESPRSIGRESIGGTY